MKMFKSFLFIAALTVAFVSCSDDDDNGGGEAVATCTDGIQNGTETGVDCGGSCNACPPVKDGSIDSQDDPDLDPTDLKGNVTANITISAAQTWALTGALTVKSGAVLTIEAGTTFEATAGGTNVYIAVEQGAQINATGTAAAPIVMTSAAGNPRPGDWGGLVIAGRAPINVGATAEAEVIGLTYGGTAADDNSGTLTYVRVEYTGARINGESEFNGITLYGVGSATTVNHIAVFNGADDGIEFFGGTVNTSNVLLVNCTDDSFDVAEGYVGSSTNVYIVREEGFLNVTDDPRGIEADSNSSNNDAMPRSNFSIDGLTIINAANVEQADLIKIRRGCSATITNGLLATIGDGTASDVVDLTDGRGPAAGTTSIIANVLNVDVTDIKNEVGATVTLTEANAGGADAAVFGWTNFTFPAIVPNP